MRGEGLLILDEDGRSAWLYGIVYVLSDQFRLYLSESSSSTSSGRELVLIGGPQTPTPQDT